MTGRDLRVPRPERRGKTTTVEILERLPAAHGGTGFCPGARPGHGGRRLAGPGKHGLAEIGVRARPVGPGVPGHVRRVLSHAAGYRRPSPWSVSPARRARSGTRLSGGQRRRLDFFAVTEKVEALYGQDPVPTADTIGPKMARLRREHHRMLGNGWCTRPPELDCAFESICETCTFFQTSIEFRPTLAAQRDDALARHQDHRGQLFASLLTPLTRRICWVLRIWGGRKALPTGSITLRDRTGHGERAHCSRSARTASRYRSLRWRCRSGYSARHPPITRQRSLVPLAARHTGASWSWPHRYGGASRVRKSIVPPGCWPTVRAGGPGASAVREGGRTGSRGECTIRACGSAVTGPAASGGLTRFAPSVIASRRRRRATRHSGYCRRRRLAAPGREGDGRQRWRTAGVMTVPGVTRARRRRWHSPVKAAGVMRSLHRWRRSGGPGSRRWCVPGCRSLGAAGGPGSGSGCGGRPCA